MLTQSVSENNFSKLSKIDELIKRRNLNILTVLYLFYSEMRSTLFKQSKTLTEWVKKYQRKKNSTCVSELISGPNQISEWVRERLRRDTDIREKKISRKYISTFPWCRSLSRTEHCVPQSYRRLVPSYRGSTTTCKRSRAVIVSR